jgi:hypothetical protein
MQIARKHLSRGSQTAFKQLSNSFQKTALPAAPPPRGHGRAASEAGRLLRLRLLLLRVMDPRIQGCAFFIQLYISGGSQSRRHRVGGFKIF